MIVLIWPFLAIIIYWFTKKWLQAQSYIDLPGPAWYLSLPIIGHSYMLGSNPCTKLLELRKKYGNIFRFDVGNKPTVILLSKKLVNEAFKREDFSGRTWLDFPTPKSQAKVDQQTGNKCTNQNNH